MGTKQIQVRKFPIIRKTTNGGDLAKYRVKHMTNGNQSAIAIIKLTLSNTPLFVGAVMVKQYKDRYLHLQAMSFTPQTLTEIVMLFKP